ncbi:hypothetical protein CYMTET_36526 [Cymbomonas tetramitiformis]|uniref:Uncharacterized protein n=1 Tax=Cymbomonas tetramitiformis TaxID=36881 RepID=A0AAE0F6X3_9CHLO|nr:hypothetical protein CYMTET_36526 [Cymbomonas tetramitiformis]
MDTTQDLQPQVLCESLEEVIHFLGQIYVRVCREAGRLEQVCNDYKKCERFLAIRNARESEGGRQHAEAAPASSAPEHEGAHTQASAKIDEILAQAKQIRLDESRKGRKVIGSSARRPAPPSEGGKAVASPYARTRQQSARLPTSLPLTSSRRTERRTERAGAPPPAPAPAPAGAPPTSARVGSSTATRSTSTVPGSLHREPADPSNVGGCTVAEPAGGSTKGGTRRSPGSQQALVEEDTLPSTSSSHRQFGVVGASGLEGLPQQLPGSFRRSLQRFFAASREGSEKAAHSDCTSPLDSASASSGRLLGGQAEARFLQNCLHMGGDAGVSKPASMPSQQKRRSKLIAAVQSSLAMRQVLKQGISWEAALAADAPVEEVYVAASRLADTLKLKKQLQLAMPLLKGVQQEADLQAWRNRCLRTILQPLEGPPWEDAAKRSSALTTSARSKPPHSTSGLCRWLPEKCWEAGGMAVPLEIPTTLRFSTRRELVTVAQMNHSIQVICLPRV